jgi:hypothetical protein
LISGFGTGHHSYEGQPSHPASKVLKEVTFKSRHTVLGQDLLVLGFDFLDMLELDIVEHWLSWHGSSSNGVRIFSVADIRKQI